MVVTDLDKGCDDILIPQSPTGQQATSWSDIAI